MEKLQHSWKRFRKTTKMSICTAGPLVESGIQDLLIWNRHDRLSIAVLFASTDSRWSALGLNPALMTRNQYLPASTHYWTLQNFSNWFRGNKELMTRHFNCVFLHSCWAFLLRCLTQTCSFHSKWNPSRNEQLNKTYMAGTHHVTDSQALLNCICSVGWPRWNFH